MKLTLFTEEVIDGAHQLVGYNGKCSQMHGHSWLLQIWIQGDSAHCDAVGILFDFTNIKRIKDWLDHHIINEETPFTHINPTAENISQAILDWLLQFKPLLEYRVRIYETVVRKETFCQVQ